MEEPEWHNRIYVGGGYLRSIVSGETVNDVDVFVNNVEDAETLANKLAFNKEKDIYKTDNAYTVRGRTTIQIIHRWVFNSPEEVSNSFDFTCCCAVIYYNGTWDSYCDNRFYIDLASKRIVYRNPIRNEDAGGSMLRVLKYYQKGYRIPLDSLGAVMARMVNAIRFDELPEPVDADFEPRIAKLLTAMLVEVDPAIDPLHLSHLPSNKEESIS